MKMLKDIYQKNDQTLKDAFDRVVAEIHIHKQKENLKSFILCGCEPGVGNTTMAINLAISMANSGWKTLLIDADMRKGKEHKRLNEETTDGLSDYLTDAEQYSDIIYATNYHLLDYIGSGGYSETSVVSRLCSSKMKDLLEKATQEYDYIIIDMPSLASAVDASILATQIDAVVLVTKHGSGKMKYIKDAKKKMEKAGANILGIIVNKVGISEYKRSIRNYDYFKKQKYLVNRKKGR